MRECNVRAHGLTEEEHKALHLCDEIGTCPHVEVHLKLCDELPFFVYQYRIKEKQKLVLEKEMNHLEKLEIIQKGLTGYSSVVVLAKRKHQNLYIICTDFWIFNDKLVKINHGFPLVKDCILAIGQRHCEVIALADIQDTYHTLRLILDSKRYYGMTPFCVSAPYFYLRVEEMIRVQTGLLFLHQYIS